MSDVKQIAAAMSSGTSDYGVDEHGHLCARGYGELHGRSFSGAGHVRYVLGDWRVVCAEARDWSSLAAFGGCYAYLAARERGLAHEAAVEAARRLSS